MSDAQGRRDSLAYHPIGLGELEQAATEDSAALPYLLAVKFNYDVKQGGFAQLLYNLRGEFLADTEDLLTAANAAVAHDFYVRAVTICLENEAEYHRFLASDYAAANEVKHALQLLSLGYLQKRIDFVDESAAFLAACPRPRCLHAPPDRT